jgi:hypothetical protein
MTEEASRQVHDLKVFSRPIIVILITFGVLILSGVVASLFGSWSSSSAEDQSKLAREAVVELRTATEDSTCRSLYSSRVTDGRQALDDANADLLLVLGSGIEAELKDDPGGVENALIAYVKARNSIEAARIAYREANTEYQDLQAAAQLDDQSTFRTMCRQGPSN